MVCKDRHFFWFRAHFCVSLRYNLIKMIHLFRKNDKSNPSEDVKESVSNDPILLPDDQEESTQKSAEPAISRVEIDRMVKEEAKRMRVTDHILTAPHLQRIKDALRLNETKLANVEENLMRTREQKDRLRRFKELQSEMELQRAHLFEVNKLMAGMLGDKKELDRFETFENVQGRFQHLQVLEKQRREQKQRSSTLAAQMDTLQRQLTEEQKRYTQCMDEASSSEEQLRQGQDAIRNSLRLEGSNDALELIRRKEQENSTQVQSRCHAMEKDLQEQQNSIDALAKEMEKKRTRLQSTEAHKRMTKHGELLVEQLGNLHDLQEKLDNADQRMKEAERRQRTENDLLGRVFADYQQIEAKIKSTGDELQVHRQSIHGLDSYQLQERAMRLKRRRQMLKSAQALWRSINKIYILLEEKKQEVNSLRLHQEHTAENVRRMEQELGMLRRSCQEKEYTFTLSKSQNVIQLRGDLKEGFSCTVCGATHHPYHSDTMLEQNKLIGELKTEAELLRTELRNKEAELLEARLDLERTTTSKKRAEDELIVLREIQNESVKDWAMYAELDPTFHSCDSSVNAEARTAMLRQLIENIETDVKKAQDELDNYNFHQSRINELAELMGRHEQTRNDLTTRMNEINTSCQVVVREVEWISARKQELTEAYGRLFERVDKYMSLPDWQNTWKRGHENIIMRIQELTTERQQLTARLQEDEHNMELMQATLQQTETRYRELKAQQQTVLDNINSCENLIGENNKELERMLEDKSPAQFNDALMQHYISKRKRMEEQRDTTQNCREEYLFAKGRLEELSETATSTDANAVEERSALDIWIRQYNASHSPVQYAELQQFFEQERDWTQIRQAIREADMESKLTQAKVDQLKSQMVALQAEGNIPDGDTTEALLALAKQEEVLEKRRMDAMMQIAQNTITLQAHEKAEAQVRSEKMSEK